jgi:hypothetical protein
MLPHQKFRSRAETIRDIDRADQGSSWNVAQMISAADGAKFIGSLGGQTLQTAHGVTKIVDVPSGPDRLPETEGQSAGWYWLALALMAGTTGFAALGKTIRRLLFLKE